jgi:hypothetical protein
MLAPWALLGAGLHACRPICYHPRVSTCERAAAASATLSEREMAPGVWLCQNEVDGQFVEIVLPLTDLQRLLRACEQEFPQYAIRLCQTLAARGSGITVESILTPELLHGVFNTQVLGLVVRERQVGPQPRPEDYLLWQQAFGLALKGRLRLTVDGGASEWQ